MTRSRGPRPSFSRLVVDGAEPATFWGGLRRAPEATAGFHYKRRLRSGVRRSGLRLQMVRGGRWGGVVRQGGRPFRPAVALLLLHVLLEVGPLEALVGRAVAQHEVHVVAPEAEEREACRAKAEGSHLWRELGGELRRPRPASEVALNQGSAHWVARRCSPGPRSPPRQALSVHSGAVFLGEAWGRFADQRQGR